MTPTTGNSSPTYYDFDPTIIPYQKDVLRTINGFDYSRGVLEILLSGSVGSAKSTLMAHAGISHCLENPGAILGIGRKAMPDLKDTIFQDILDHLSEDFDEGIHYKVNNTRAQIFFYNGSKIISRSWSDGKYKKWRSIRLSAALIEEVTENDDDDKEAIDEMRMRVGRVPGVKENFIIYATNPDSPAHWAYKYFIKNPTPTRMVFYSKTTDNPFLPPHYINSLRENLDPLLARRMIDGEWLEIKDDIIYHQYQREHNFLKRSYDINTKYSIHMSFDFNIGDGKPMSAVFFQYIGGQFHFFDEIVIHGARTEEIMEDATTRGLFDFDCEYEINGDAAGKHRDTRSKSSDYEIIQSFLRNYRQKSGNFIRFIMNVPMSNPPVRTRHNTINAYLCNANGLRRLFVYEKCVTLDEGFSLTKLKKGGQYLEDDSKHYQHITTAAGYGIMSTISNENKKGPSLIPR
jgi:hypothetical protein